MFSRRVSRPIALAAAAIAAGGGAYGIVSATASGGSAAASTATTTTVGSIPRSGPAGGGARSGPAAGGTVGTVVSVSNSGLTVSTSAGQKVTVQKTSSTKYLNGSRSASAGSVKKGAPVLVLGTTNGTTITATQVIVQPTGGSGTTSPVVPFQRGAPSTAKQVGQIPANYTQGSGTIVSGTTANKATVAALSAYPGGVVDRVVKLSNGEYEVHNIGVNWPHHIFVNKSFKVVGAN
jgi:hypothetical protein